MKTWSSSRRIKKHSWTTWLWRWGHMWGLKVVCRVMMLLLLLLIAISMSHWLIDVVILRRRIDCNCLLSYILICWGDLFQKFWRNWTAVIQLRFRNWNFFSLRVSRCAWHRNFASINTLKIMLVWWWPCRWIIMSTLMVILRAVICVMMIMRLFLSSAYTCSAQ